MNSPKEPSDGEASYGSNLPPRKVDNSLEELPSQRRGLQTFPKLMILLIVFRILGQKCVVNQRNAANAYGSLKDSTEAWRIRGGRKLEVHIGATAASKILFAIRQKALMPWDEAMRTSYKHDGSPISYSRYLKTIRNLTSHIGVLCRSKGFQIDDLPKELGQPNSTVLALVNEYIWVTETRKCELPSSHTLARWVELG